MAAIADASDSAGGLTAPMPGTITNVAAKIGAVVTKGETLVVMEAMKMEYAIKAPSDGTVTGLPFGVGDQVQEAALLVGFEPSIAVFRGSSSKVNSPPRRRPGPIAGNIIFTRTETVTPASATKTIPPFPNRTRPYAGEARQPTRWRDTL